MCRCVPYRVKKDDEGNPCSSPGDDDQAQVEVLMISTPNRTDMVFPKVTIRRMQHSTSWPKSGHFTPPGF